MNYFALTSFFNGLFALLIGIYVLLKNRKNPVYLSFALFAGSVAGWAISYVIWQLQTEKAHALFFIQLTMAFCSLIPFAFLWFVWTLIEYAGREKFRIFCVALPSFFFLANFTPLMTKDVVPKLYFPYWPTPGWLMHVFVFLFFTIISYCFYLLFREWFRAIGIRRWQLKWVTLTTLLMWLCGSTNWFLWYDIPIPPIPNFSVSVFFVLLAYAIIQRQLFDLEAIAQSFQKEKLATIGLLAASVNHEIRNPLYVAKTTLESYLESEEKGTGNTSCPSPFPQAKKSLAAVNRALDVITKLNRFAKPASETVSNNSKASIPEALQNVLDLVSYEFELDKIKIINNIPKDFPSIQADQRQLEEILFNLIVNACHAMSARKGDGQEVLPSTTTASPPVPFSEEGNILEIRSTMHDSRITIEIKDSGTGISPEQAKHLFEPFHTTKGENGTGLGLYITKQLVERNGGKIEVSSTNGKGSTFTVIFPKFDDKLMKEKA